MKRCISAILFLCIMVLFSGCSYDRYEGLYPKENENEIWVSAHPYSYFYWDEELNHFVGYIEYNGRDFKFVANMGHCTGIVSNFYFQSLFSLNVDFYPLRDSFLAGDGHYNENFIRVQIDEDNINFFDGKMPVITFVRCDKADYIEDNGPLKPITAP